MYIQPSQTQSVNSEYNWSTGKTETIQKDENLSVFSNILPDGSKVKIYSDENGRRVSTEGYDENGNLESVTKDIYDENGQLSGRIFYDENGDFLDKMSFEYDSQGRLTKSVSSDIHGNIRNSSEIKYNSNGTRTTTNKNSNGDVISYSKLSVNKNNETVIVNYDKDGKRTGSQTSNADGIKTTTKDVYDSNGQLSKIIVRDAEGNIINTIDMTQEST